MRYAFAWASAPPTWGQTRRMCPGLAARIPSAETFPEKALPPAKPGGAIVASTIVAKAQEQLWIGQRTEKRGSTCHLAGQLRRTNCAQMRLI